MSSVDEERTNGGLANWIFLGKSAMRPRNGTRGSSSSHVFCISASRCRCSASSRFTNPGSSRALASSRSYLIVSFWPRLLELRMEGFAGSCLVQFPSHINQLFLKQKRFLFSFEAYDNLLRGFGRVVELFMTSPSQLAASKVGF